MIAPEQGLAAFVQRGDIRTVDADGAAVEGDDVGDLLMNALGYYANPYVPEALEYGWNEEPVGPDYAATLAPAYFNMRKTTIYAGSNEIQRNIIAKAVLGL